MSAQDTASENAENPTNNKRFSKKRTFRDKWRLTPLPNKIISLATAVIAGASLLTFGTAVLQWNEMRSAGTQTDKIIAADERFATAMENSVAASGKVFDATIAQNQLDQRAWIGIRAIDSPSLEANQPIGSAVHLTNTGKTLAIKAIANVVIEPSPMKLDIAKFAISAARPSTPGHSAITIFPNFELTMPIQTTMNATAQDIENIKGHKLFIYVFGEVYYTDIFQHMHTTHYCGLLNPDVTPPVYRACDTYNDAD